MASDVAEARPNCRHIANASIRGKIGDSCRDARMRPPVICTPEELMEA
jgi:hypothetical protein